MDAECLLLQSALGYIIVISTHTQCARGGDRDIVWRDVLTSNQVQQINSGKIDPRTEATAASPTQKTVYHALPQWLMNRQGTPGAALLYDWSGRDLGSAHQAARARAAPPPTPPVHTVPPPSHSYCRSSRLRSCGKAERMNQRSPHFYRVHSPPSSAEEWRCVGCRTLARHACKTCPVNVLPEAHETQAESKDQDSLLRRSQSCATTSHQQSSFLLTEVGVIGERKSLDVRHKNPSSELALLHT
ncbi:hypothetical protein J6590_090048 [Homalodisca vitripennis]|nr:hypothetical protein J6590_090048 [Homalodisca vitripennis]